MERIIPGKWYTSIILGQRGNNPNEGFFCTVKFSVLLGREVKRRLGKEATLGYCGVSVRV